MPKGGPKTFEELKSVVFWLMISQVLTSLAVLAIAIFK